MTTQGCCRRRIFSLQTCRLGESSPKPSILAAFGRTNQNEHIQTLEPTTASTWRGNSGLVPKKTTINFPVIVSLFFWRRDSGSSKILCCWSTSPSWDAPFRSNISSVQESVVLTPQQDSKARHPRKNACPELLHLPHTGKYKINSEWEPKTLSTGKDQAPQQLLVLLPGYTCAIVNCRSLFAHAWLWLFHYRVVKLSSLGTWPKLCCKDTEVLLHVLALERPILAVQPEDVLTSCHSQHP